MDPARNAITATTTNRRIIGMSLPPVAAGDDESGGTKRGTQHRTTPDPFQGGSELWCVYVYWWWRWTRAAGKRERQKPDAGKE